MSLILFQTRIKSIDGKIMEVVYENNPQLEFSVNCECVRLLPPSPATISAETTVGDEVDVYTRTSDDEPFGWWPGHIRMIIEEWRLIEYATGRKEFVLLESIRPRNPNDLMSFEPLVWGYWSEKPGVRLHDTERHHAEQPNQAPKKQPRQAWAADRHGQPTGRAVGQQKVQPSKTGVQSEENTVFTEESWEKDATHPPWHLSFGLMPPKKKKGRRHKKQNTIQYEYTMDDEYDDEEVRLTEEGSKLYRLYDGQWREVK